MEIHSAYQEKRIRVLDVPVSRGTFGAERNFDCNSGGDPEVLEKARPVLEVMNGKIIIW